MGDSVTLTIYFSDLQDSGGTIKVENENLIKEIFPDFENNILTTDQFNRLKSICQIDGAADTLEAVDISSGKNRLKSDIIQGKADLSGGVLNVLKGGTYKGDIYVSVPKGTSMSEIKRMYNLPDGALRNYCRHAGAPGGDFDTFKTIADEVWFSAEDFARGNNMKLEEVKNMFGK